MSTWQSYREIVAWQRGMDLWVAVHEAVGAWPSDERFEVSSQARRAANSIPANIAEGFGRQSKREFLRHTLISNGSLYELETHLIGAGRLGYLDDSQSRSLLKQTAEVGRLLSGLIRSPRARSQPKRPSYPTTKSSPHHPANSLTH